MLNLKGKTVYVAGKITGEIDFQTKFADATCRLKEYGAKVINPCCLSYLDLDYEQYFPICFAMIDVSDTIYMLEDWRESNGATKEYYYALSKGKEIIYAEDNKV